MITRNYTASAKHDCKENKLTLAVGNQLHRRRVAEQTGRPIVKKTKGLKLKSKKGRKRDRGLLWYRWVREEGRPVYQSGAGFWKRDRWTKIFEE